MEEKKRTIDTRLEQKIGFDRIRRIISDRCSTSYAAERTATETFSTNPTHIRKRLLLTDEMRLIMMFEDSFPSGGFIDCIDFLPQDVHLYSDLRLHPNDDGFAWYGKKLCQVIPKE